MLREEWEASVNDVLVRSEEQADLFADAAEHLGGAAGDLCRRLADRRRQLAADLDQALKARGLFPKVVDPERERADKWLANLRSAMSGHEVQSLLHSRLTADEHLDAAINEAMCEKQLPAEIRQILDNHWSEVEADRHALAAFLASGPGDA